MVGIGSAPARATWVSALAVLLAVGLTAYTGVPEPLLRYLGMSYPDLYEASIEELQDGLKKGRFTSVDLVKTYLARIEEVNTKGPELRAVLQTNPNALKQATELDEERKVSGLRGPLHGIPILLKDNISTRREDGMNTTAGSHALVGAVVPGDAFVAAKLRAAGALILGKASLSEWAYWRGKDGSMPSGWCGVGGQCLNPYVPQGNPSGSSAGSGVAAAIGLAAATLGSETDGSIISPSSYNNIVGIKPTVGLTSRAGVVPISEHQDSVGPMCRSVADVAVVLTAIVGRDPQDNYSLGQPVPTLDYTQALQRNGLQGARIGVPRNLFDRVDASVLAEFDKAIETMRGLGATVVDPADFSEEWQLSRVWDKEYIVLCGDFRENLNTYLSKLISVPTAVRTVTDIIAYNTHHPEKELIEPYCADQRTLIESDETLQDPRYWNALAQKYRMGRGDGIDGVLKKYSLDAVLLPTAKASQPAAVAGYPVISVPLGFQPPETKLDDAKPTRMNGPNMPFGISFLGTAYSEFSLIKYAYAFEQATKVRLKMRAMPESTPKTQLADVVGK